MRFTNFTINDNKISNKFYLPSTFMINLNTILLVMLNPVYFNHYSLKTEYY